MAVMSMAAMSVVVREDEDPEEWICTFTNLTCNPTGWHNWLLLDSSCWATHKAAEAECNPHLGCPMRNT